MEEWKEYKLGDLYDVHNGLSKGGKFFGSGYPFLSFKTVFNNYFLPPVLPDLVQSDEKEQGGYDINRGDVFVTRTSETPEELGMSSVALKDYPFATYNGFTKRLRPKDTSIIYPEFIGYYLRSTKFRALFYGLASSMSTRASLANGDLLGMKVFLPTFSTQEKIASILKSLDDKIEVNRKINENLEQQAQTLFKSWFVDFEPFKNGEFVESELGMIPKGWRVGRYDDIIESTISGDWGKEKPEGNYTHRVACIRGCDFQDIKNGLRGKTPERYILEKNFLTKHFKDKDVLVEISGGTATVSTGRVCPVSQLLIDKFNEDIVCTNFCRLIRPKPSYGAYLYYSWLYKFNNKVMFGYENGTSGIKNFRIKDFTSLEPIIIPPESSLQSFQPMIDNLQMKLQMNGSESQKLATLRDTLLPKLMSGELKVNDVEI